MTTVERLTVEAERSPGIGPLVVDVVELSEEVISLSAIYASSEKFNSLIGGENS